LNILGNPLVDTAPAGACSTAGLGRLREAEVTFACQLHDNGGPPAVVMNLSLHFCQSVALEA